MGKKRKQEPAFEPLTIVIVDFSWMTAEQKEKYAPSYPFKHGDHLLHLGEIKNMPGHLAVVNREGKVVWGFHDDNFRLPTEDEI